LEGVHLNFREDALREIAKIALLHKTGARGLRAIMEKFMIDIMYDLPEQENITECLISKNVIMGDHAPVFTYKTIKKAQSI